MINNIKYNYLTILLLLLFLGLQLNAQSVNHGQKMIKVFSPDDYKGGSHINDIVCGKHGLLFAADKNGVLEFNGHSWRQITCGFAVKSMAQLPNGTIYLAGTKGIGMLQKDSSNTLVYHSLNQLSSINWHQTKLRQAQVFCLDKQVIFVLDNEIVIHTQERKQLINSPVRFSYCQILNGQLYLYAPSKGIFILNNQKTELLSNAPQILNKKIGGFITIKNQTTCLVVNKGLFNLKTLTYNKHTELDKIVANATLNGTVQVNSSYLIKTIYKGAYLLNKEGWITNHFKTDNGLSNNNVLCASTDQWNNLWFGTSSGISSIRLDFPFTRYNSANGIGTGYAACSFENQLYLGTSKGLYQLIQKQGGDTKYELLLKGKVYHLQVIDGNLYCVTNKGLYNYRNKIFTRLYASPGQHPLMATSAANKTFITVSTNHLVLLTKQAHRLKESKRIELPNISYTKCGYNHATNTLWLYGNNRLHKAQMDATLTKLLGFTSTDSVENARVHNIFNFQNSVKFITNSGIYKETETGKFKKDTLFDKLSMKNAYPTTIVTHKNLLGSFYNGKLRTYKIESNELKSLYRKLDYSNYSYPIGKENIRQLNENFLLIGQDNGFWGFQLNANIQGVRSANQLNRFLIRKRNGQHINIESRENVEDGQQKIKLITKIPHGSSVKFYYSSGYSKYHSVKYASMLVDYDTQWTDWTDETMREFSNLPAGNYQFIVRSINKSDEESYPAICEFEILPPWYLSTWFKVLFVVLLTIKIIAIERIIKLRMKRIRLKIEKEKEEQLFREKQRRKEERLIKQKEQTETLNRELKAENYNQSKDLANTTIDIVKKKQFLIDIKHQLEQLPKTTSINEIIHTINDGIEDKEEWKVFENQFDSVHEKFLKRLKDRHSKLTAKDLRMCAYLRMNLSTKDIAPLLNISVRGVEISRYRLRKKLDLDRNINIIDYLVRF